MDIAVVVSGSIAETMQLAPLLQVMADGAEGQVVLLCPASAAEAAALLPGVGEVLALRGLEEAHTRVAEVYTALRRRRFDTVLLCSSSASVRLAAYLAAVARRLGCRLGPSDRLLTGVTGDREDNRGQSWLGMAALLGLPSRPRTAPPVTLQAALDRVAEQQLLATGVGDGRLLVAIAPGAAFAGHARESWAPERWAHLANRLSSRHGAGVVLVGDAGDRDVAEAMRVDLASVPVNLCGELTLTATAAVIARCDLLVSADTPLLQLAAALGTPSVGLFARTAGRHLGWAGPDHRIVQALPPGPRTALDRIHVDDVLAAIEGAA